jgi:hypothetical protein
VLAFRATAVLRRIRVRNERGLAIRRHQWGDSRKCGHRPLQADGEHHDDRDELTLHTQKLNYRSAPKQIIEMQGTVTCCKSVGCRLSPGMTLKTSDRGKTQSDTKDGNHSRTEYR